MVCVGSAFGARQPTHQATLGDLAQCLITQRVDARPDREGVTHQDVQALHPVGHAAGGHIGDLRHGRQRLPVAEVPLMGTSVVVAERGVCGEPVLHLPQLVGLALGLTPKELRIDRHMIPMD